MRPFLFLDIDGVLNSTRYWYAEGKKLPVGRAEAIDPRTVVLLNKILKTTNALLVLSSSWRSQGHEVVERALKSRGLEWDISAMTPIKEGCRRCAEIEEFLDHALRYVADHPRVAILDDDSYAYHPEMHQQIKLFLTDYRLGLQPEHVNPIITWLMGDTTRSK